jgi:hypothetical protein
MEYVNANQLGNRKEESEKSKNEKSNRKDAHRR